MADTRYVQGGQALSRKLLQLAPAVRGKYLRGAVGSGAKVVRDEAIAEAPLYHGPMAEGHPPPGTLKKAIVMKYVAEASTSQKVTFIVAVRHGKGQQQVRAKQAKGFMGPANVTNQDAFYWRFTEFGTSKMAAANGGQGFMRPAFRKKQDEALQRITGRLWEGVQKEATR